MAGTDVIDSPQWYSRQRARAVPRRAFRCAMKRQLLVTSRLRPVSTLSLDTTLLPSLPGGLAALAGLSTPPLLEFRERQHLIHRCPFGFSSETGKTAIVYTVP